MILLIDNYDSFSYNLFQLVGSIEPNIKVIRNDECSIKDIENMNPDAIIISPGPGKPDEAGICIDVIKYFYDKKPIFGVCLGHQAICEAFGATVSYAKQLMHGKQKKIYVKPGNRLFEGMGDSFMAARYHSLAALKETLPEELMVTAESEDGEIMAVEHKKYPVFGVQFHPESVMTPEGKTMIKNFLKYVKKNGGKTMIKEAITKLTNKENLSYDEAKTVMDEIFGGETSPVLISSYLTALAMKGETADEISASAESMREHAEKLNHDGDVLEIVGTGGDKSFSFNISSTAAMIIASAGVPVAKHGNRAASSKSGAADVLEALGVNLKVTPEQNEKVLKEAGICFQFAQTYHKAMKYVGPVRKELGIRTVFNILGPLTNPAKPSMQLLGVYSENIIEEMANVLDKTGVKRGLVVYGQDCMDEISLSAPTTVCELNNGKISKYVITPEQFGYERCSKEDIVGGTPEENADITRAILKGEDKGHKRKIVCLNAGAALYIAGKAESIEAGVRLAENLIDCGKAYEKMEDFIRISNQE